MPSSLNLNGLKIYKPGVYATVDASALGGQNTSTGNVCLVGAFPSFEADNPLTFTSAGALRDYDSTDKELALLGKLAFAPSVDARVPAGVNSLTVLNVQTCTQAKYALVNDNADTVATFEASVWGNKGNNTYVTCSFDGAFDVTLNRNGLAEEYLNVTSGDVCSFEYTGTALTTASLDLSDTNNLVINWTKTVDLSSNNASVNVTDMKTVAGLGFQLDEAPNANVVIVISGYNVDGVASTQTITLSNTTKVTSNVFSQVYGLSITNTAQAGLVLTISGVAFDLDLSTFDTVNEVVDFVNQANTDYHFTANYLASKSYSSIALDGFRLAQNIKGVEAIVAANLQELIDTLASSKVVSLVRVGSIACDDFTNITGTFLLGGTQSSVILSDWTNALELIETSDIQIVVPWSSDVDVHKEILKHCTKSAVAGSERNAWVGASANQSIIDLKNNWVKALNNRNVAIVGQSVKVTNPQGIIQTLEPKYLALICASMQAGTPVSTPLTRKRPDVVDVLGSWIANRDVTDAIKAGICALTSDNQGWRIERSVTTWIKDDNPIYSEVSANESINTSVRDLRNALDIYIGDRNLNVTSARILGIVSARLDQQVLDGIIKAYKNIVLENIGDTLKVNYTVAAVEPLNFIAITASVSRF
jgi:hypothetical protein